MPGHYTHSGLTHADLDDESDDVEDIPPPTMTNISIWIVIGLFLAIEVAAVVVTQIHDLREYRAWQTERDHLRHRTHPDPDEDPHE